MDAIDWPSFLRRWNDEMLASPMAEELPEEARQSKWLGFAPATHDQIATELLAALDDEELALTNVSQGASDRPRRHDVGNDARFD